MVRHLVSLGVVLAVLAAVPGLLADDKKAEKGWVQLFNGKDKTGWKTHPNNPGDWQVEDGILIGKGKASHLFSERGDYENFRYRVAGAAPGWTGGAAGAAAPPNSGNCDSGCQVAMPSRQPMSVGAKRPAISPSRTS